MEELAKLLGVPVLALMLAQMVYKKLLDHETRISKLEGINEGEQH